MTTVEMEIFLKIDKIPYFTLSSSINIRIVYQNNFITIWFWWNDCEIVRNDSTLCTHESKGFLHALYKCCWKDPLSEVALLAGTRQKVREQDEAQFQGGRVNVGLKEEQEPITAQGIKHGLLPTSRGREHDRLTPLMSLPWHYGTWNTGKICFRSSSGLAKQ